MRKEPRKRSIYQGIRKRVPGPTRVERDRREDMREREAEKEMEEQAEPPRDREQGEEAER